MEDTSVPVLEVQIETDLLLRLYVRRQHYLDT